MSTTEKLNEIQVFRLGYVPEGSAGTFLEFIETDPWIAFALCGKANEYLLTQTSEGFEKFSSTDYFKRDMHEGIASFALRSVLEIESLIETAFFEKKNDLEMLINRNGFVIDPEEPVESYAPSIFCSKNMLDPDFDVMLNVDNFEIKFDADKFFTIAELPFFSTGYNCGIFGIRDRR